MTKEDILEIIKLLSALESWGYSNKQSLPDFIQDNLSSTLDLLCKEVLK
jgi:hypothetical protein